MTAGILLAGAVGLTAQDRTTKTPAADEPAQPKGALENYVTLRLAPNAGDPAEAIARLAREAKQHDEAGNLGEAQNTLAKMQEVAKQWQDKLTKERAKRAAAAALDAKDLAVGLDYAHTRTARSETGLEERVKAMEQKLDLILKRLDSANPPRNRMTPPEARPK